MTTTMNVVLRNEAPPMLSPPDVFGQVEFDVYRGKQIYPHNFAFLKQLRLKTIVKLTPEPPFAAVETFCETNDIALVHLGVRLSDAPVSDELIKEALEIVLDRSQHPVLLMCASGVHQTATVVGCLRRLQQWNMTSILVEVSLGLSNTKYALEQFIEFFDVDLVSMPEQLPHWFRSDAPPPPPPDQR